MGQAVIVVDAFADRPFTGNPAAVCVLAAAADESWMQLVAREMSLSETAFLHAERDGFRLRWFTPTVEVDLCGHATLASAHVLWESGRLQPDAEARFLTRSGLLTARRRGELIVMDFPIKRDEPCEPPPGLFEAVGRSAKYVGKNVFDYVLELESEAAVRTLAPDLARIAALPVRGVIVTSRSDDPRFDFVSRFFAPRAGVPEDPVTGSAHCCLAPYWSRRLGKDALVGHQISARGGVVHVEVHGERVALAGRAVTMLRGELAA